MQLTQEAIDLLNKVKAYILEEPKRFNMNWWGKRKGHICDPDGDSIPPCGTVCCIAGTMYLLSHQENLKDISDSQFYDRMLFDAEAYASDILETSVNNMHPLFYIENWPEEFRIPYLNSYDLKEKAKITCERIDYYINVERGSDES